MRIAVIADTHDRYPPELPGLLRGADEIWHLGDVCAPETLAEFKQLGVPLRVVLGNNDDFSSGWPVTLDLKRGGVAFHLVHIPPRKAPAGARVLLHGHTHVPRDDIETGGVRWLNPGCISYPRASVRSFAWLDVDKGSFKWELVKL
jgi:putative phosphoesterase